MKTNAKKAKEKNPKIKPLAKVSKSTKNPFLNLCYFAKMRTLKKGLKRRQNGRFDSFN